jgi:hypothetical protein
VAGAGRLKCELLMMLMNPCGHLAHVADCAATGGCCPVNVVGSEHKQLLRAFHSHCSVHLFSSRSQVLLHYQPTNHWYCNKFCCCCCCCCRRCCRLQYLCAGLKVHTPPQSGIQVPQNSPLQRRLKQNATAGRPHYDLLVNS